MATNSKIEQLKKSPQRLPYPRDVTSPGPDQTPVSGGEAVHLEKMASTDGLTATRRPKPPPEPMKDRLPAGSRKVLDWDGQNWVGVLTVPGVPTRFSAIMPSEKRCYWALDDRYREWLATFAPASINEQK